MPEPRPGTSATPGRYRVERLGPATWDLFADLVERNNGIDGGRWCAPSHIEYGRGVSNPQIVKEQLVRMGRARTALALVLEGGRARLAPVRRPRRAAPEARSRGFEQHGYAR
jgi:hypothetical protein